MTSFKTQAHIHSLDGAMDEITILDSRQEADHVVYIVDYKGVKCTAIVKENSLNILPYNHIGILIV